MFEGEIEDQTKVQRFIISETVQEKNQVVSHRTDDGQSEEMDEKTYTTCRPKQVRWAEFSTNDGIYTMLSHAKLKGDDTSSLCHRRRYDRDQWFTIHASNLDEPVMWRKHTVCA